jgi:hypothetical protein
VQNRRQVTAVRLKIKLGLAYALDTGQIGGGQGPDDHVYDYVSY